MNVQEQDQIVRRNILNKEFQLEDEILKLKKQVARSVKKKSDRLELYSRFYMYLAVKLFRLGNVTEREIAMNLCLESFKFYNEQQPLTPSLSWKILTAFDVILGHYQDDGSLQLRFLNDDLPDGKYSKPLLELFQSLKKEILNSVNCLIQFEPSLHVMTLIVKYCSKDGSIIKCLKQIFPSLPFKQSKSQKSFVTLQDIHYILLLNLYLIELHSYQCDFMQQVWSYLLNQYSTHRQNISSSIDHNQFLIFIDVMRGDLNLAAFKNVYVILVQFLDQFIEDYSIEIMDYVNATQDMLQFDDVDTQQLNFMHEFMDLFSIQLDDSALIEIQSAIEQNNLCKFAKAQLLIRQDSLLQDQAQNISFGKRLQTHLENLAQLRPSNTSFSKKEKQNSKAFALKNELNLKTRKINEELEHDQKQSDGNGRFQRYLNILKTLK